MRRETSTRTQGYGCFSSWCLDGRLSFTLRQIRHACAFINAFDTSKQDFGTSKGTSKMHSSLFPRDRDFESHIRKALLGLADFRSHHCAAMAERTYPYNLSMGPLGHICWRANDFVFCRQSKNPILLEAIQSWMIFVSAHADTVRRVAQSRCFYEA